MSRVIAVTASGFFMSDPSLAKILLYDTPTETVSPVSFRTALRISSAMCVPSPETSCVKGRSIQHSSIPKGSIASV